MKKKRKVLVLSLVFTFLFAVSAFAGSDSGAIGDGIGTGELISAYSNGMRNVYAQSYMPGDYYSSLQVTSTYFDGSEDYYSSGIQRGTTTYSKGYEWTEDYSSIHDGYGSRTDHIGSTLNLSVN